VTAASLPQGSGAIGKNVALKGKKGMLMEGRQIPTAKAAGSKSDRHGAGRCIQKNGHSTQHIIKEKKKIQAGSSPRPRQSIGRGGSKQKTKGGSIQKDQQKEGG